MVFAEFAEAGVARRDGDFRDIQLLQRHKNLAGGVAVFLRRFEDVGRERVDDGFGGGAGHQQRFAAVSQRLDLHGFAAGARPDHREHLFFFNQLFRERHRFFRVALRIFHNQHDLIAIDAAVGVDLIHEHLRGLLLWSAQKRSWAGDGKNRADFDLSRLNA